VKVGSIDHEADRYRRLKMCEMSEALSFIQRYVPIQVSRKGILLKSTLVGSYTSLSFPDVSADVCMHRLCSLYSKQFLSKCKLAFPSSLPEHF